MHFADRIIEVCRQKQSRLVVGLDPHWQRIPDSFKARFQPGDRRGPLTDYFSRVVERCLPHAVAFKPQIAFFEQFGIQGLSALGDLLSLIRERDGLVIMDAKRNDIGSTAAAYARAYFGDDHLPAAFPSDALTINAYLGEDGVLPFLTRPGKAVFVLVKTSNPSSGRFQDLVLQSGEPLADSLADAVSLWNHPTRGRSGYGNVGAVIGATYPEHMRRLRCLLPHALLLVPGYGAQGGSDDAVRAAFNEDGLGALINSSRAILFPEGFEREGFDAVERAARDTKDRINLLIQ